MAKAEGEGKVVVDNEEGVLVKGVDPVVVNHRPPPAQRGQAHLMHVTGVVPLEKIITHSSTAVLIFLSHVLNVRATIVPPSTLRGTMARA